MRSLLFVLLFILVSAGCENTDNHTFQYTAGNYDLEGSLVYTDIEIDNVSDTYCLDAGDELIPAQTEQLSGNNDVVRVWWQATLSSGETMDYSLTNEENCSDSAFNWQRTGDQSIQLRHNGQPYIQYEHPAFDSDNIEETKKPFHHVFDPTSGEVITKGHGGLYSHHRGIFFGYNLLRIDGKQLDIWHANDGERSEHEEIISEITGPVLGGHDLQINWKDHEGEIMLDETRAMRVFRQSDERFFVDFHTSLTSLAGSADLNGDLQHAGVQFRASQHVADHTDGAHFIRPDDWSHIPSDEELGEDDWENLPWNAMQYSINETPYTVVYMSHPSNPAPSEMSERRYGRFGEFIPYQLDQDESLELRYRFWIVVGEAPTVDEMQHQYQIYSDQSEE